MLEAYDTSGNQIATAEVDSEGHFAFFVPSSEGLEIRVAENGYKGTSLSLQPIPAGRRERKLDINLIPWNQ